MKLLGKILCKCLASVVFPEHVAPLKAMDVSALRMNGLERQTLFRHTPDSDHDHSRPLVVFCHRRFV